MIILEGTDCVGKTTIAQAIKGLLPDWGYQHFGVPKVDPFCYFGWFLAHARQQTIVDRCYFSEYAYGKTYRNCCGISRDNTRILELLALAQNAVVLHVWDDIENINTRWNEDQPFDINRFDELQKHFDTVIYESHVKSYKYNSSELYDFEKSKPKQLLVNIIEEHAKRITPGQFAPTIGCGSKEGFMIVGEGQDFARCNYFPITPLQAGFASDWLWKALYGRNIQWWRGYYTNACNFRDHKHFIQYCNEVVKPNRIVCLGSAAANLISETSDYEVRTFNHPMYERRFRYKHYEEWANNIQMALLSYVENGASSWMK